jgi:alpha-galactosidase
MKYVPAMRLCAAAFFAIAFAGCGGGGSSPAPTATAPDSGQPAPQPAPSPAPAPAPAPSPAPAPAPARQPPATGQFSDLVIIGNSITKIGPNASLGWTGDWGMAATSPEKDFAHLTAAAMGLPLTPLNFSPLEKDPMGNLWQIPSYVQYASSRSAVVVELGDNVPEGGAPQFALGYGALLDALHVARLVCVSTWWKDDAKDAVIEQGCKAHGGKYVFIGDIYPNRADDIGRYANVDVDRHPHDWSMQVIATRVTAALVN